MVRQLVESSSISSVGFDPASQVLEVEFRRGGRVYRFFDVPEFLFKGLMVARSKGTLSPLESRTDIARRA
jgi:hypothetical protein